MIRDNVKLNDVFENLAPEHQDTINEMVNKKGEDRQRITVGETLKLVAVPDMESSQKMAVLALMGVNNGKYVPKLNHEQRCQVLALYRTGITREALSDMFGINTRTVGHIYSPDSPHYRNVKEEEKMMGRERFIEKYMTDELLSRAMSYRQKMELQTEKNNRYAIGKAGVHIVRPAQCINEHRIIISWRDDLDPPGWYYQDRDSEIPDAWLRSEPESMKTSRDCYLAMLRDLTD